MNNKLFSLKGKVKNLPGRRGENASDSWGLPPAKLSAMTLGGGEGTLFSSHWESLKISSTHSKPSSNNLPRLGRPVSGSQPITS